jgi:hypothetical protein
MLLPPDDVEDGLELRLLPAFLRLCAVRALKTLQARLTPDVFLRGLRLLPEWSRDARLCMQLGVESLPSLPSLPSESTRSIPMTSSLIREQVDFLITYADRPAIRDEIVGAFFSPLFFDEFEREFRIRARSHAFPEPQEEEEDDMTYAQVLAPVSPMSDHHHHEQQQQQHLHDAMFGDRAHHAPSRKSMRRANKSMPLRKRFAGAHR